MTRPDIHQQIVQLTSPHTHREPYEVDENGIKYTADHVTLVKALIDQLDNYTSSSKGDAGTGTFESRPAASVEALDVLIAIDDEAARWIKKLGQDDHGSTKDVVRRVASLRPSLDWCGTARATKDETGKKIVCCTRHKLDQSIRSWHTRATIATGWAGRAFAPNNTCPTIECGQRRTLRIAVEEETAFCTACHSTWGGDSTNPITTLAECIRKENGEELEPEQPIEGDAA